MSPCPIFMSGRTVPIGSWLPTRSPWIRPERASWNGTDGTFVVYVQPGTYTVSEKDLPTNTEKITGSTHNADDKTLVLKAGESATAGFYNHECLGSITITKRGRKTGESSDTLLSGAEFTLYRDGREIASGTTDGNGHLRFDRLPYGNYTIRETLVPEGYVDETYEQTVTVSADQSACSIEVVNHYNLGPRYAAKADVQRN